MLVGGALMRVAGIFLIVVGIIWILIAFNMDTSVASGSDEFGNGRVENIGLIAQRQSHLFVAGLTTLVGVLLTIWGGRSGNHTALVPAPSLAHPNIEPPSERDLQQDSYRLWLAEKYSVKRNEVFDRFVIQHQTYPSLDEALAAAHANEVQAVREADEREESARIAREEWLARDLVRSEQNAKFFKKVGLGALAAATLASPFIYLSAKESLVLQEQRELAERKRMDDLLAGWGIVSNKTWLRLENQKPETVWCDGRKGTVVELTAEQAPQELIAELDRQLGNSIDPYASIVPKESTFARIYAAKEKRGSIHVTAFGGPSRTNAYLCIEPSIK